ncbi:MAG: hypothetical protein Q7R30_21505 [Acidobacteriota bacterium]|nr:hypothetical protein [Acidobacteriota bacterium]
MFAVLAIGVFAPVPASAQASPPPPAEEARQAQAEVDRLRQELAALREQYEARLAALEERIKTIAAGPPTPAPEPVLQPVPVQLAGAGSSKMFNPDIAVIGNFLGVAGQNKNSDQPALGLNEVETSLQAVVDPYARADFFLAAGPEGLEIEEGFVTFTSLPAGLLLKAGKMRAQFGKVNTLHAHALPWTDRPLVTQNLVGGEEGISLSGVSLSRLISNSALFLEATGEAFYGDSEVFASPKRSKLTYVGRLRAYRDITEGSNLDVGGSFASGPSAGTPDVPAFDEDDSTRLVGFDATFRYRPLRRAIYRRFLARTELVWSRPRSAGLWGPTAFGFYGSGEYQFARRWFAGARYDRSARAFDNALVDEGGSVSLTFWPSEFNQIRGQYRRTNYGDGVKANEFLFQILFSIGAHGAHVF